MEGNTMCRIYKGVCYDAAEALRAAARCSEAAARANTDAARCDDNGLDASAAAYRMAARNHEHDARRLRDLAGAIPRLVFARQWWAVYSADGRRVAVQSAESANEAISKARLCRCRGHEPLRAEPEGRLHPELREEWERRILGDMPEGGQS